MISNFREFEAGPDPFGRTYNVTFVWQQTAISIRHADCVDVKFLVDDGEMPEEKVVALPHPKLREMSGRLGRPLSDAWCMKLAAVHLVKIIETGEDIEKSLVTMSASDLEAANAELSKAA